MKRHTRLIDLAELLDEDLGAMCTDLKPEFGEMSGSRLLVTGEPLDDVFTQHLVDAVLLPALERPSAR